MSPERRATDTDSLSQPDNPTSLEDIRASLEKGKNRLLSKLGMLIAFNFITPAQLRRLPMRALVEISERFNLKWSNSSINLHKLASIAGLAPAEWQIYPDRNVLYSKLRDAIDYVNVRHPANRLRALVVGGSFANSWSTPYTHPDPEERYLSDLDLDAVFENDPDETIISQVVSAAEKETGIKTFLKCHNFADYISALKKTITFNAQFAEPFRSTLHTPDGLDDLFFAKKGSAAVGIDGPEIDSIRIQIELLPARFPEIPHDILRPSTADWNLMGGFDISSASIVQELEAFQNITFIRRENL